jgi:hypothetical protein
MVEKLNFQPYFLSNNEKNHSTSRFAVYDNGTININHAGCSR